MKKKLRKLVLAYSGGLDTSVCIRWLTDKGYRVTALYVDLGQGDNVGLIRRRAVACGAHQVIIRNVTAPFARDYILPALKAGAIYEGKYLLATALSRPLIAQSLVEVAQSSGAGTVAHGCTGKGNDQVRLEVSLKILSPGLEVLAPVRDWELTSRQEELRYAKIHRLPIAKKSESRFSIDQNLWGVSIESGPLEDPWVEPPEGAYRWTQDPMKAPDRPQMIQIDFAQGAPVALNGKRLSWVALIGKLNELGGRHGVGRADLMEDRLIGIKSREVYEAPGAFILHTALRELERLTLDRETLFFKDLLAQRYARLIYDGLWFTPLKRALDAFVEKAEEPCTGAVRVKLFKGNCVSVGRKSAHSRYDRSLATYEGKGRFNQRWAAGFIALWGLPYVKVKSKK